MFDYLVVGSGLAGISFCETLEQNGKTFKLISDDSQQSSKVAAGLYNPVILKRFSLAWKANEQMEQVVPFYHLLERKLKVRLDYQLPVLRRFASVAEQNLWFEARDKDDLRPFLSAEILPNKNEMIDAPLGYGKVLGTGRIDTSKLFRAYRDYLCKSERHISDSFNYESLGIGESGVRYENLMARQVVFCEGYGLQNNPFFNYLPLNGTKGELLTIKAPDLKERAVIKSSVFIIPLQDDLYRVGATYKWKDKTNSPTKEARSELLKKLKGFVKCKFEVIEHSAGIRPTVADRRPLVGRHPKHRNLYILNGFGSRGVLIGPYASKQLFDFIENGNEIEPEMTIDRFAKKYARN